MARFDLSKYATVAERLVQFQADNADSRIETEIVSLTDTNPRTVVVKASVFLTAGDQANRLPAATGHATETEGGLPHGSQLVRSLRRPVVGHAGPRRGGTDNLPPVAQVLGAA